MFSNFGFKFKSKTVSKNNINKNYKKLSFKKLASFEESSKSKYKNSSKINKKNISLIQDQTHFNGLNSILKKFSMSKVKKNIIIFFNYFYQMVLECEDQTFKPKLWRKQFYPYFQFYFSKFDQEGTPIKKKEFFKKLHELKLHLQKRKKFFSQPRLKIFYVLRKKFLILNKKMLKFLYKASKSLDQKDFFFNKSYILYYIIQQYIRLYKTFYLLFPNFFLKNLLQVNSYIYSRLKHTNYSRFLQPPYPISNKFSKIEKETGFFYKKTLFPFYKKKFFQASMLYLNLNNNDITYFGFTVFYYEFCKNLNFYNNLIKRIIIKKSKLRFF